MLGNPIVSGEADGSGRVNGLTGAVTPAAAPAPVPVALKAPAALTAPSGVASNDPAPTQVTPATQLPPIAPLPNPTTPLTNPATGQSASAIGTPAGYNVGAGVDTSPSGLLPGGFSMSSLLSPTTPADATTPGANSYTAQEAGQLAGPTQWNVTADQTVAGQYAGLMATGNPAIQAAEQSTIRANAANGGNNSLMAQTAATLAGSQVALTIAQQDAQVHAQAGQYNATAANTFAEAQNQFIQNATLSQQNFQQGVAMLKDQTNQSMQQLFAQVQANVANTSISLKAQLATIQTQTNATLETMDKTFAQSTATAATQEGYAKENAGIAEGYNQANATQTYGNNVRLAYLSAVNTSQTALQQTIASIQSNPNINTTQANAAVQQAVDQFNSFMTMNNAYYASMTPAPAASNPAAYLPGFPNN
jgi:hypothetical protein